MNIKENRLSTNHYRLRKYILEISEAGEIAYPENIRSLLPEYDVKDYRRKINRDVRIINAYGPFDKPIISMHDGGYKIPTREEYKKYSDSRWNEIGRMAKLQRNLDAKAGLEGQGKIGLDPYGSETFEPFIKNEVMQDVENYAN